MQQKSFYGISPFPADWFYSIFQQDTQNRTHPKFQSSSFKWPWQKQGPCNCFWTAVWEFWQKEALDLWCCVHIHIRAEAQNSLGAMMQHSSRGTRAGSSGPWSCDIWAGTLTLYFLQRKKWRTEGPWISDSRHGAVFMCIVHMHKCSVSHWGPVVPLNI